MIRFLFALVLWSQAAVAQDMAVQSGEHAGFTRLSIAVGAREWAFGRSGAGYALLIPDGPEFGIARAFDLISRHRVAGLSSTPGRLNITLGCDPCHARLFPFGRDWLVIDIHDGRAPAGSVHENPVDPPADRAAGMQAATRHRVDRGPLPLLSTAQDLPRWFLPVRAMYPPAPAPLAPPPPPQEASADAGHSPRPAADDVARAMVEGMIRAADQGLLDLNGDFGAIAGAGNRPAPPPGNPPPAASGMSPPITLPDRPGLSARTVMDDVLSMPGGAGRRGCLEDGLFDVAAWAGGGDFATELGAARLALTDERDRITQAGAERLARAYLAYGFGREALEALTLHPGQSRDRDILRLIAQVVDGQTADPGILADQAGCTGQVVLWRGLALGSIGTFPEVERIAAVTAFRLLPDVLRRQLAPRLARLMIEAGDPLAAREILARVPSADFTGSADSVAIEVALARSESDPAAAVANLLSLIRSDPRAGPGAMVALVDLAVSGTVAPQEIDLDLLRALRFEGRGGPDEAALAVAEVRILAHLGRHDEAIGILPTIPAARRAPAIAAAVAGLVAEPDDARFLATAFDNLPAPLAPESAHLVAARLIDLGFAARALDLLAGTVPGPDMTQRRLLRAAAHAALVRSDLAEADLLGLPGITADAIPGLRAGTARTPGATEPAPPVSPGPDPGEAPGEAVASPLALRRALLAEAEATRRQVGDLLATIASSPARQ
ncbi:MAG: hypothetical protein IT542_10785 [Rubellimicrobium sp.]|nr:hypothetical protein [Rubellimicrobium sp.]